MYDQKEIGICVTCKNNPGCQYMHCSDEKKHHCEGFEYIQNTEITHSDQGSDQRSNQIIEESNEFTGLCKNCDLRTSCANPESEVVIWHCNEYQ